MFHVKHHTGNGRFRFSFGAVLDGILRDSHVYRFLFFANRCRNYTVSCCMKIASFVIARTISVLRDFGSVLDGENRHAETASLASEGIFRSGTRADRCNFERFSSGFCQKFSVLNKQALRRHYDSTTFMIELS